MIVDIRQIFVIVDIFGVRVGGPAVKTLPYKR